VDLQVKRYESLAEADAAELQYYWTLTPEERLEILLDLIETYRSNFLEASEGFERVYRVDELFQC
jgi:hypothetical protein